MSFRYYKLFDILQRRGMRRKDLMELTGISSPTMAKLTKGESVTTEVLEKICRALNVQPGDIMEYERTRARDDVATPDDLTAIQEAEREYAEGETIPDGTIDWS